MNEEIKDRIRAEIKRLRGVLDEMSKEHQKLGEIISRLLEEGRDNSLELRNLRSQNRRLAEAAKQMLVWDRLFEGTENDETADAFGDDMDRLREAIAGVEQKEADHE